MNRSRAVGDYRARPAVDVSLGPLFEHAAAAEAAKRDEGIARATSGQPIGWPEYAYSVLVELARTNQTVHVDQFVPALQWQGGHPNAMGGVWLKAIKNGVLDREPVAYEPTRLPGKHLHRSPRYRSLVFGQKEGRTT